MVHGHINHAQEYFNLAPGIRLALDFLARTNLAALAEGRHSVDEDRVFALVSDYATRLPEETFWEAHRRHIDVQFVVSGEERIGYGNIDLFDQDPYDASRDLIVARGQSDGSVAVRPGEFVILFPHDVHMPGLQPTASGGDGQRRQVRKVVMKVRIEPTSAAAVL